MKNINEKISEALVDDFIDYFFHRIVTSFEYQNHNSKEVVPEEIAKNCLKEIRKFLNKEDTTDLLAAKIYTGIQNKC